MESPARRPSLFKAIRRGFSAVETGTQPAAAVTLEVGRRTWHLLEESRLRDDVRAHVASVLRHDMQALGIPAAPEVELRAVPETADDDLCLRVNDRLRRLPAEQVAEIVRRLTGEKFQSVAQLPPGQTGLVVAGLCKAAIHRRPSTLLGDEQFGRYRDALGRVDPARADLGWPPAPERLRQVLIHVLDAGVGVGKIDKVGSIIAAGEVDGVPPVHTAERVIDLMRLPVVQIRLNAETLRALTTHETEPLGAFTRLRERLYAESGALFPDFAFAEAPELPPGTVAFGMNALTTPLTQLPDRDAFEAIAACLASELRAHRGWFICISVAQERLAQLKLACPDLVGAAQDRYPTEWLTAVGRALFREEIPIPSLKETLEHLLDLGAVGDADDTVRISESAASSARPAIGSLPEPRDVVSYLRQRSNETTQENFLISEQGKVLMLGAEQEAMAASLRAQTTHPDERQAEDLTNAARRQIANATGKVCLGVTSVPVRSFVRELLEPEFPLVPVVAIQEFGVMGPSFEGIRESDNRVP